MNCHSDIMHEQWGETQAKAAKPMMLSTMLKQVQG